MSTPSTSQSNPWNRMIKSAMKTASTCPEHKTLLDNFEIENPWQALVCVWTETYMPRLYFNRSTFGVAMHALRRYGDSQKLLTSKHPFWTVDNFAILFKQYTLGSDRTQWIKNAQTYPYIHDVLHTLDHTNVPDLRTLLDPKYVTFMETLWSLQGSLENAYALWMNHQQLTAPKNGVIELPEMDGGMD